MLNHRTQILFQMDISLVLHHLDLKPGSVVIESGTGSGSLTTSLIRAVAPFGHVHTFEFNLDRVNKAKADFTLNGLNDIVTVRHRDVCGTGFPFFPEGVDAVFLDLPSPWVVVDDCHRNLRPQGRFCSFSPCIEQVQRVCVRLAELGYEDIMTIEVLTKGLEVHQSRIKPLDLEKAYQDLPGIFKGITRSSAQPRPPNSTETKESKDQNEDASVLEPEIKRRKIDEQNDAAVPAKSDAIVPRAKLHKIQIPDPFLITKPSGVMRGHTGYLTFSRKPSNCVVGQHDVTGSVSESVPPPADEDENDDVKEEN